MRLNFLFLVATTLAVALYGQKSVYAEDYKELTDVSCSGLRANATLEQDLINKYAEKNFKAHYAYRMTALRELRAEILKRKSGVEATKAISAYYKALDEFDKKNTHPVPAANANDKEWEEYKTAHNAYMENQNAAVGTLKKVAEQKIRQSLEERTSDGRKLSATYFDKVCEPNSLIELPWKCPICKSDQMYECVAKPKQGQPAHRISLGFGPDGLRFIVGTDDVDHLPLRENLSVHIESRGYVNLGIDTHGKAAASFKESYENHLAIIPHLKDKDRELPLPLVTLEANDFQKNYVDAVIPTNCQLNNYAPAQHKWADAKLKQVLIPKNRAKLNPKKNTSTGHVVK